MVSQKGWKRGEEKDQCTVCVESLFEVPTMFNLTALSADRTYYVVWLLVVQCNGVHSSPSAARNSSMSLQLLVENYLNSRKRLDAFIVCVPAKPVEGTQDRYVSPLREKKGLKR